MPRQCINLGFRVNSRFAAARPHHQYRGSPSIREARQRVLPALGVTCSIGPSGCCCVNAVRERFSWSFEVVALRALDHNF